MFIVKKDQDKIIEHLENKRTGDPLIDATLSLNIGLIKIGLIDWILAGNNIDEFIIISIGRIVTELDTIFKDEEFIELLSEAYDNAVNE